MELKDMTLVTENDRGTEINMLMTLDDYKSFIAIDDMSELADNLLQLGRTLGDADNFAEYYRAASRWISRASQSTRMSVIRLQRISGKNSIMRLSQNMRKQRRRATKRRGRVPRNIMAIQIKRRTKRQRPFDN